MQLTEAVDSRKVNLSISVPAPTLAWRQR